MFVTNGVGGVRCTGCGGHSSHVCTCGSQYSGIYSDNPSRDALSRAGQVDASGKYQPAGGSLGIPVLNWGGEHTPAKQEESKPSGQFVIHNDSRGGIGVPRYDW